MLRYDPNLDAYAVLGVHPAASQEEIEAAFRKAALLWHPDKSRSPDAKERFYQVQGAGEVLRDPVRRREYDRMRQMHLGSRARARMRAPGPAEADVPMRPPPDWLTERVKVHFDSVLITLDAPVQGQGMTAATFGAACCLGAAVTTGELTLAALAVVLWAISRVLAHPPHRGHLCWAKITPGRKVAEYHALDQSSHRYERKDVPFGRLAVAVTRERGLYRIEIRGFPASAQPILLRTRSYDQARRCAREAGRWLQLPCAA